MPEVDAQKLLDSLRRRADQQLTNFAGERVWLKQIEGGLTDCCLVEDPCEYHATLTHPASAVSH